MCRCGVARNRVAQPNIFHILLSAPIGQELEAILRFLNKNGQIVDPLSEDLLGLRHPETGRMDMTAGQVLR